MAKPIDWFLTDSVGLGTILGDAHVYNKESCDFQLRRWIWTSKFWLYQCNCVEFLFWVTSRDALPS